MKTKTDTTAKRIIISAGIFFFILFMIPVSYGFYTGVKMHTGINEDIEQSLKKNCACENVNIDLSTFGLHLSKEAVANETITFQLEKYENMSFTEEANRLNDLLKTEVTDYEEVDLVTLNFKDLNGNEDSVTIKNGIIQ